MERGRLHRGKRSGKRCCHFVYVCPPAGVHSFSSQWTHKVVILISINLRVDVAFPPLSPILNCTIVQHGPIYKRTEKGPSYWCWRFNVATTLLLYRQTAGGSLDRRRWRQLAKWNAHSLNFGSSSQKGKKPMPASKHIFKMGSKGTTLRVGSCLPAKFWVLNSWRNCRVKRNSGVVSKMVISTSPPSRQLTFQVVIRKHILKDRDKKCL